MSDKQELLNDYDLERKKEKNIEFKFLLVVYLAIFLGLLLLLPKIYIKNQIYYISRDINKLNSEYSVLKEENRALKQKVEYIRFKNQVLDSVQVGY